MADDSEDRTPRWRSSDSARDIYTRLMALPRDKSMSNNEWAKRAGVNTSFFTNLRNGSDPSINNLRAILRIVNCSLPEFFLVEAASRVVRMPKKADLELALEQALTTLPKRVERRPQYLAEVLLQYLALPEDVLATQATQDDGGEHVDLESPSTQGATKKVARS